MSLIIPCAGSSSRFPNMKPKWMLTTPKNVTLLRKKLEEVWIEKDND